MPSPEYTQELVISALRALSGDGPLEQRLVSVGLSLMELNASVLPEDDEARTLYGSINERLTSLAPVGDEGSIDRSVGSLSAEQRRLLARDVVRLADLLWTIAARLGTDDDTSA